MTEDHRVASTTERARIARTGQRLKDGEVRLNGTIPCAPFRVCPAPPPMQLMVEVKSTQCMLPFQ